MTAQIYGGLGTILAYSTTVPATTYTSLSDVVSLDGPEMSMGTADTTNLATTGPKTHRPTIADLGTVSGSLQLDPADTGHVAMLGLMTTTSKPALVAWKITFADAAPTSYAFLGTLTGWKITGMTVEGNLEVNFSIKVSGNITSS